jgi:hypothetical protein
VPNRSLNPTYAPYRRDITMPHDITIVVGDVLLGHANVTDSL